MMRTILAELLGLFVDDGALALGLVLWCGAVGLALALLPALPGAAAGAGLLAGCLAILLADVRRAARRPRAPVRGGWPPASQPKCCRASR